MIRKNPVLKICNKVFRQSGEKHTQYNLKHGLFVTQERPEVYLAATVQCGRCACFIVIAGKLCYTKNY